HDTAHIASMRSTDGGWNWTKPEPVFRPTEGALNAMSVSILRLRDGRLGCVFCIKHSLKSAAPFWSVSEDEGGSWSEPKPINSGEEYFVVNNDRLIECHDGTLIIPYALHRNIFGAGQHERWDPAWNAECGLFFSRDGGTTWKRSTHTITHTPEVFREPRYSIALTDELRYEFENRLGVFQEPGVVELENGRLLMHMRSAHCIYHCHAESAEAPWECCAPMHDFHVCLGPQTIRRIPGGNTLIMFYNDRGNLPFGSPEFGERTPLSVAVSEDGGNIWRRLDPLEDEGSNYCYFSLLIVGDTFFTTFYESACAPNPAGLPFRRNLASLKFRAGLVRDLF
ncbi:MAG: sialidase family protein, partial [Verrucomicrobiota bacterium]